MIEIRIADLTDPAVRALVEYHKEDVYDYSPAESVFALDWSEFEGPGVTLWAAHADDEVAGDAALRDLGDGSGEVKCMRTHWSFLRQGIGRRLLNAITDEAQKRGYHSLRLETGAAPFFLPAIRLYESFGFREGPPYGHYPDDGFLRFFHLELKNEKDLKTKASASLEKFAVDASLASTRQQASNYPEPFASQMSQRCKQPLGDGFGLSAFGVNRTTLLPGGVSALHHRHSHQDEFVYVLEGRPTLHIGTDAIVLAPGMCAGFAANGLPHHLSNETDEPVVYLEVGNRHSADTVDYPHDDLVARKTADGWLFTNKAGQPYPMARTADAEDSLAK